MTPDSPPRILLVDDDVDSTELLSMLLSRRGFHISIANSLAEARAAVAAKEFQVVVVDLELPDGSGYELAAHLDSKRTHAIALTGSVGQLEKSDWQRAGFQQLMVKPVDIEALVNTLRRVTAPSHVATSDNPPQSVELETIS